MTRSPAPRAGVLLEVLVSIAVFAAAAAVLLGVARDSIAAMDRADERERAVDVAGDIMARLVIGEISLADLRSGRFEPADTAAVDGDAPDPSARSGFRVELRTQRTPYRGLVLVELAVRSAGDATTGEADQPRLCTLRQLVRLGRPSAGDLAPDETAPASDEPAIDEPAIDEPGIDEVPP